MKFTSVDNVLDFAIGEEEAAAAFYRGLAARAGTPELVSTLLALATEEDRHRERLLEIKAGDLAQLCVARVQSLFIADYLVEIEPSPSMSIADALRFAMNSEQAAFQLYTDLAGTSEDPGMVSLFSALAREEERHKVEFERRYEAHVLGSV